VGRLSLSSIYSDKILNRERIVLALVILFWRIVPEISINFIDERLTALCFNSNTLSDFLIVFSTNDGEWLYCPLEELHYVS